MPLSVINQDNVEVVGTEWPERTLHAAAQEMAHLGPCSTDANAMGSMMAPCILCIEHSGINLKPMAATRVGHETNKANEWSGLGYGRGFCFSDSDITALRSPQPTHLDSKTSPGTRNSSTTNTNASVVNHAIQIWDLHASGSPGPSVVGLCMVRFTR